MKEFDVVSVTFKRSGDKFLSQGTFVYNKGEITLSKQTNFLFSFKQKVVMTFSSDDILKCQNGEMRGYRSVRFILKNGETVDVSLTQEYFDYFMEKY